MAPEYEEYEEERPPECCGTCRFWVWDTWYQGEKICDNDQSFECGERKIKEDRCSWWEADEDG